MGGGHSVIAKPFKGIGSFLNGASNFLGKTITWSEGIGGKATKIPFIGPVINKIADTLPIKETVESIKNVNKKGKELADQLSKTGEGFEKGWSDGFAETKNTYDRLRDLVDSSKGEVEKNKKRWSKEGLILHGGEKIIGGDGSMTKKLIGGSFYANAINPLARKIDPNSEEWKKMSDLGKKAYEKYQKGY